MSVLRSAYVEGAMRTNVVSCDSAAVTLLLGVLHVPQLYSLWGSHGFFREKTGRKGRQPRAVRWTGGDGKRRDDKKKKKTNGGKEAFDDSSKSVSRLERRRADARSSRGRERKADRHEGRDPTYPCFVAASTMAATVMPATPLCASSTYALFLMVPASYPSAVASALHAIRRFLFAAPLAPASVPSEPLLSPGFAPFRPGVPPELVVAGVVGAPGGAFAAAVALFSSSSTRRRLLVAIYGGRWFAEKSRKRAKCGSVFTRSPIPTKIL